MELLGTSQSTFGDMVSELGLSAAMRPKAEHTLLAPVNSAFTSKSSIMQVHLLVISYLMSQLWFILKVQMILYAHI